MEAGGRSRINYSDPSLRIQLGYGAIDKSFPDLLFQHSEFIIVSPLLEANLPLGVISFSNTTTYAGAQNIFPFWAIMTRYAFRRRSPSIL